MWAKKNVGSGLPIRVALVTRFVVDCHDAAFPPRSA